MSDWLSIIIIVLIIGIVLDGFRRARNTRRNGVRMSKNVRKADELFGKDVTATPRSEFPSGGARPKLRSGKSVDVKSNAPQQADLALDDPVPMLMDSVIQESAADEPPESSEYAVDANNLESGVHVDSALESMEQDHAHYGVNTDVDATSDKTGDRGSGVDSHEPIIGDLSDLDAGQVDDSAESIANDIESKSRLQSAAGYFKKEWSKVSAPESEDQIESESIAAPAAPEEIIIINMMSKPGEVFLGDALLDVLTDLELRFGSMGAFHRHLENDPDSPVVYSMANIVEPGSFDLSTMRNSSTKGLCMFLSLPTVCSGVGAYEDLIVTARALASRLGGELKDENRSALTNQTIEHGRQRVMEFERKHKLRK